jgi:hypothetical protein
VILGQEAGTLPSVEAALAFPASGKEAFQGLPEGPGQVRHEGQGLGAQELRVCRSGGFILERGTQGPPPFDTCGKKR